MSSEWTLRDFAPVHVGMLERVEPGWDPTVLDGYFHQLADAGPAWTATLSEVPMCCGGMFETSAHRAIAWAWMGRCPRPAFLGLHHLVLGILSRCTYHRIETTVRTDYAAGHRWARALGFVEEAARMRSYFPDGNDATLYARIV